MIYLSTLLISMFLTITLMPFLKKAAVKINAMDVPQPRKVHTVPIPKCGGIAMAVGAFVPVLLWAPEAEFLAPILMGAGVVTLFGLVDDFTELGYKAKLAGQIIAALIVIFYGGIRINNLGALLPDHILLPGWAAVLLTLVVIIGVTNAINLSDGLDGLAGGICLLIFISLAFFGYRFENMTVLVLSIAMVGAVFGFLRFNTYPATLFMGDAGSQLLGFMAVTLSLKLTQGNTPLSPVVPLILLGFPILDTLTVMVERILKGRSPFIADKNHFHHKLMRLGLYQTEAVFIIYVIQCCLVISAFAFRFYSEWFLLILYGLFSGVVILGFTLADRYGWQLKRQGFMDRFVKGRLRKFKERHIPIKLSFRVIYGGVPLLLVFSCFLSRHIPMHVSIISFAFLVILLIARLLKKVWADTILGVGVYLFIPFVIYLSEKEMVQWMTPRFILLYDLSFVIMAVFVFLTLRLTRRRHGFEITPMHFLILFIALIVPNLPDAWIRSQNMGMVAAKMIVLFFGFEVLIGELRGETKKIWGVVVVALMIFGVRGVVI